MKTCKKCNKKFPIWNIINGEKKNLQNRDFCLSCSPYKQHNTRDITKPKSAYLKSELYNLFSDEDKKKWNNKTYSFQKIRRLERKLKLIHLFGAKCQNCGYCKNFAALNFHHKDPKQKEFPLSINMIGSKTWSSLLEESKKCELLCSNCHAEYHYPHCLIT